MVKGHDVVLRNGHVLLKLVGALQNLVVLLDFSVRASSFTSMTARLFELERITPTSVTTPVMHATMIDSMKTAFRCPPFVLGAIVGPCHKVAQTDLPCYNPHVRRTLTRAPVPGRKRRSAGM